MNSHLSAPAPPPPSSHVKTREHYITIDSRDRNRDQWPSTSHFEVKMTPSSAYTGAMLNKTYKNIKSIEFVNAVFPNLNGVLSQMYLYLVIPEIEGVYDATNHTGLAAFAKLIPTRVVGNYVYTSSGELDAQKKIYELHGQRIDKLTLQFKKYDGTIFDFGPDTASGTDPLDQLQTSVTLKITTNEPSSF
jgi:hypothetical protein